VKLNGVYLDADSVISGFRRRFFLRNLDLLRLALQHFLVLLFQLSLALFLTADDLLLLTDGFRRGSGMGRQEREEDTACCAKQHGPECVGNICLASMQASRAST